MMTRISSSDDANAWCRHLGNFAPIVYRPAATMAWRAMPPASDADAASASAPLRLRAQRGAAAVSFLLAALIAVAMAWPLSASAQGGGMMGGHGGHGNHANTSSQTAPKDPEATATPNPLRAMLGEMRKLRADLLLDAGQIGPWSAMEDALRECVDLDRSRASAPNPGAAVDPQQYVQDIADRQRELADAEAHLAAATKTAFAALNPRQLRTSNERLAGAITGSQAATASLP